VDDEATIEKQKIKKMKNAKLEWTLRLLLLVPIVYVCAIFNSLPETVPVHFGLNGEPNAYGNKWMVLLFPVVINPGVYLLLSNLFKIDPKGKIDHESNQFTIIKAIVVLFFTIISVYLIYITVHGKIENINALFIITGVFFTIFGNYLQTIKPNYFVGIKTPWALENEANWRITHRIGGRIMFVSGILITLSSLMLAEQMAEYVFFICISLIVVVPFAYSYIYYIRNKKEVM
jgi:uncharacterized membrane protein